MVKSVESRLERLERAIYGSDTVFATRWDKEPVVYLMGSGEEMTLAEFAERYPSGTLIHFLWVKDLEGVDDGKAT